jgi:hypothetical protein
LGGKLRTIKYRQTKPAAALSPDKGSTLKKSGVAPRQGGRAALNCENNFCQKKHYLTLSADKPLIDPQEDQLGYALFARHLAFSLTKMVPAEGFVVAIYGPWGSGKTTLLNFLFHYFKEAPVDEQPIIVPFKP